MRQLKKRSRGVNAPADPILDINTTPLIDVMLVLLIMLIITIPIQLDAVKLHLPQGTPPANEVKPEVLRIDIDKTSAILWNGENVVDTADLEKRIEQAAHLAVQPEVHIRPDRKAKYEVVAQVLAASQRLGLKKLGIVGSEQFVH